MLAVRTSATDPIQVAKIELGNGSQVGITFCPGKKDVSLVGNGRWERDIDVDLKALANEQWQYILTLVEEHELEKLGVSNLGEKVAEHGMVWMHYPIVDGRVPAEDVDHLRSRLKMLMNAGARILVHCKGGLGRAGTVAAMMLMDSGEFDFCHAIATVRHVRPDAIETIEQIEFLMDFLGDDD